MIEMEQRTTVTQRLGNANLRPWLWLAGITLLTTACVLVGRAIMPWEKMFPDFITYWTAAKIIASGQNPYDVELQIRIQRDYGWDKATNGRGVLDFLPYYYPPWFGMACTLFLPLGYAAGKAAWFFVNLELLFLTGFLLRDVVDGLPRSIPLVAVPLFFLSGLALIVGQTSILIVFLIAVSWRLLERRWDWAAGVVLALLTTKPQLTVILVLALLIWSARRRRFRVVQGFAIALAALALAGALIVPSWPIQMLEATRRTPPPTEYYSWLGATWFLVLKTFGLRSWGLWVLYLAVALPFLREVVKSAIAPDGPLCDVMALGLLAAFFVAPYGRHYDFPALLIPAFILIGGRLPEKAGSALLIALLLIPYLQFMLLVRYSRSIIPNVNFFIECTYFWIPVLLAAAWFGTSSVVRRPLSVVGSGSVRSSIGVGEAAADTRP
jgi:Glycosyltransferase family 87